MHNIQKQLLRCLYLEIITNYSIFFFKIKIPILKYTKMWKSSIGVNTYASHCSLWDKHINPFYGQFTFPTLKQVGGQSGTWLSLTITLYVLLSINI